MNRRTQLYSRPRLIAASAAAFASLGFVPRPARAAEFTYKFGHDVTADNPIHVQFVRMAADVKRETGGRLELKVFPNSVLGTDPAMIQQVREGALEFSMHSGALLSGMAPAAAIESVPYALNTPKQVFAALDGELGAAIKRELELKTGFHVFPKMLDNGFRQVTSGTRPIRNADDFVGFKIRAPAGNIYVDVYKTLGAEATVLSLGDVYTGLQTHLVDGQDQTYIFIELFKWYEVQKYLSVTSYMWGGYWFYANGDAWKRLPSDIQGVLERNVSLWVDRQRRDSILLSISVEDKLRRQGLIFNRVDGQSIKTRLAPWYARAKALYGPTFWALLEKYSGKLA